MNQPNIFGKTEYGAKLTRRWDLTIFQITCVKKGWTDSAEYQMSKDMFQYKSYMFFGEMARLHD